jgi:hypothetical protein
MIEALDLGVAALELGDRALQVRAVLRQRVAAAGSFPTAFVIARLRDFGPTASLGM